MRRMPNVGNIIDEADYQRRMSRPPVRIEGEGEEISTPDTPIRVIGLGHDTLEQVDDTWKGELGLDLRPDLANEAIFNPQPRPAVARRVQTMPGLDLRADLAELDAEDKAISQVSGAVGDVAGRAMAGRGQALAGGTPSTPRGMVADVMKGAARGPLVPQKGAGGGIPPEVAAFVAQRAQQDGPPAADIDGAKRKRAVLESFDTLGRNLGSATDMITGTRAPAVDTSSAGRMGQRFVDEEEEKAAAVRRFVSEKMARDDRFAANATAQERYDAGQRRQAEQDAASSKRQAELDALNKRKTESEIAENQAQAARAARRGGAPAVDPLTQRKRELEIAKMEKELNGQGRMDPVANKQRAQMIEVQDRYNNIKAGLGKLKELVKNRGTYEMFGGHNKILDQHLTNIAVDMAKLVDPESVARESEVANFKSQLFSPGLGTANDSAQEVLDSFSTIVDDRLANAYAVRGIDPAALKQGGGAAQPTSAAPNVTMQPGANKVRVSNGAESFDIDPADLAEAEAEGFKRVN